MKKILLTLIILAVATATLSAQDYPEEPTPMPTVTGVNAGDYYTVYIDDVDPDATIYWRLGDPATMEFGEWMIYTEPITFNVIGEYLVETYAVAPGIPESEHVFFMFIVQPDPTDPTDMYHVQIADFGMDGIYYRIVSDSTVVVSLNDTYDYTYVEPYGWELYSVGPYSGDVVIPPTVEYGGKTYTVEGIDNHAFINCSLSSITLPSTLKSISSRAFVHATIESGSIFIPASVTSIEPGAFADCYNLATVQVDQANPVYDSRENCNAIIKTATNTLVCAFTCSTIPSSVTAIGQDAYAGDAYTGHIYYGSFLRGDFIIPDQVITIGDHAFYGCLEMTSVTFPSSLASIGNWAFAVCRSLKNVIIPDAVTSIGQGAFANCYGMGSIIIGNSVTSIDDEALFGCSSLTDVSIGNAVTSIGREAFADCRSLTSVTLPDALTTIGDFAFTECSSLASITLGNSLSSIGAGAFSGCTSLTSITIPQSVTFIGHTVFYRCSELRSITCLSTTPLDVDSECFYIYYYDNPIYDQATLFVPNESLEAYRAHSEWGKFSRIVPYIGAGPGDVNGDGNVSIGDVTSLIDQLLTGEDIPAYFDVDGSGAVTIGDIAALIDHLLGNHY